VPHRVGVDEKRRLDFGVAVLARVELEHELMSARRAGARSHQHVEARAHIFARARSRNPEPQCRWPNAGLGSKLERARFAVAGTDVVIGGPAEGEGGVGRFCTVIGVSERLLHVLSAASRLLDCWPRALFDAKTAR